MNASQNCIELIEKFEGFRSQPYRCPAGIPTIGFGSTRYASGVPISMSDLPITRERAVEIMKATLIEYENAVNRYVKVILNQNQFDALVDFAYNAGAQNLRNSTLLKRLNAGDYEGAALEFEKWVFGGGRKLNGLVRRREAERELFQK